MQLIEHSDSPRYIRLHERDNVVIVVNDQGVPAGTEFADGLVTVEFVPQSHKVTLEDIPEGGQVIRYGQIIGYALQPIPRGSWVKEDQLRMPTAPPLDSLPLSTEVPDAQAPLEGFTFEGYRNADGTVGTRNILGITTTVQCVTGVLDHAVKRIKDELLPKYPHVDDVVALTHSYGCGVAITATDAYIPIRTVRNLARNPNLGGEALGDQSGLREIAGRAGDARERLLGGSERSVAVSLAGFQSRFHRDDRADHGAGGGPFEEARPAPPRNRAGVRADPRHAVRRQRCVFRDHRQPGAGLCLGLVVACGGDGDVFRSHRSARCDLPADFPRRNARQSPEELVREMDWYDRYLAKGEADRSANTTPGNKKGGLSNIVEKSLGSIVKSGSSAINGVLGPGERFKHKGLIFCATPASDFVCGTLQLAAGMNLHVFTTGRGTPYGLAMAPVVKVSTRTELAQRWPDLIDIDAGRIATGRATIEELGWELFHYYLDVASGKQQTWAEKHKLHNDITLFNPAPIT